MTAISCGEGAESSPESAPVDTIKVDSIDSRSEGVDTIKKKGCEGSVHQQMQSLKKMENKLDRMKRRLKARKEKRKARRNRR